jgi:hypothetical protein
LHHQRYELQLGVVGGTRVRVRAKARRRRRKRKGRGGGRAEGQEEGAEREAEGEGRKEGATCQVGDPEGEEDKGGEQEDAEEVGVVVQEGDQ